MPKKIIIAIAVISLLALASNPFKDSETGEMPNLMYGLALVGIVNVFNMLKEIKNGI